MLTGFETKSQNNWACLPKEEKTNGTPNNI